MISSDGPHAHYYIRMGWARVFNAMGHDVGIWDANEVPVFDAFDEMEPDIFLGQTYNLDRALFKCIKERPHLKVVMRASEWGDMQKDNQMGRKVKKGDRKARFCSQSLHSKMDQGHSQQVERYRR